MFNYMGFLNNIFKKKAFFSMQLFFMLFFLQFHKAPTIVGLKMFHENVLNSV